MIIAAGWVVFAVLQRSKQTILDESPADEALGDTVVVVPAFGAARARPTADIHDGSMAIPCSAVSAGE